MLWFSLKLLSVTFLILRRNKRDVTKKYILVFISSTLYVSPIVLKLEFSVQNFVKLQNFMKIRPVGAELFDAEGQRDGQTGRQP